MEGLRAQVGAKLGPLPVWAWALLAVLAIVAWMYFTKSGFFAASTDSGSTGSGASADQAAPSNPDFPVGLGGLAGGGNPASPVPPAGVVPSGFDPSTGGYVGYGGGGLSSSGVVSSDPTVNFDNAGTLTGPNPITAGIDAALNAANTTVSGAGYKPSAGSGQSTIIGGYSGQSGSRAL